MELNNEKVLLEACSFEFTQDAHCMSDKEYETLFIEVLSSLGIDRDDEGNHFFVIKTDGWCLNSVDDLKQLFDRISAVIEKRQK